MTVDVGKLAAPFNGPIETGLRSLVLLTEIHPARASLDRLVILDYLLVHSDDLPGGPPSIHPRTPNRSGELLVRRTSIQAGLTLFCTRGLIVKAYTPDGVDYAASEASGWFLDSMRSRYLQKLRSSAEWLIPHLGESSDKELRQVTDAHLGEWGAEFATQSVLWAEEIE